MAFPLSEHSDLAPTEEANKMKKKQKANKRKQKTGPDLKPQPPAELTDEQLQQVVGGGGQPSNLKMPAAGDEVLVSFEGGDPSRPLIIGKLWHG